ncbi:MAG TPA: DUF917 domain-containing protein [Clostridiales bacterium]|nr:DUF917 domain-containing protein [Clostridiales bacterium]
MARWILDKNDVDALLIGLGIYGTGGGGDPEWGRKIIENDFSKGRVYEIVDPEDVEDDAFVCSGGIMGSVKALEYMSYDEIVESWEKEFILMKAFKEMEKIKGRKIDYIIPFEAGGLNTPVIMTLAARMGIPVINADAVGRSAPETQMTSFVGYGISLNPMPLVDHKGNTIVVMSANELTYADEIGRFVVTKGGGMGGNAHYAMSGAELKKSCIPGAISNSIRVGKLILEAQRKGIDPVDEFVEKENGLKLFEGVVTEVVGEDKGGFYLTNVTLDGTKDYTNKKAKLVIKNEVMAVWIDGKIKSIFPDLVCMLYTESGIGVMSSDIKEGMKISLVGFPCHERLRYCLKTEAGKTAFGGARYGYPELEYIPIEQLNK